MSSQVSHGAPSNFNGIAVECILQQDKKEKGIGIIEKLEDPISFTFLVHFEKLEKPTLMSGNLLKEIRIYKA